MPARKTIVVRLDPELLDAIQKWATDEFRSTNGQIEWIFSQALKSAGRMPKKKPPKIPPERGDDP